MSLRQEISKLCQKIFDFETNIAPLKEQLFNIPTFTKKLLWNHMVGQKYQKVTANQLYVFFVKHGAKITQMQADLMIYNYSKCKDNMLTLSDLWQIFRPRTIKMVDEIISSRQKRQVVAKSHEAHYKISDLLCKIIQKVAQFLVVAERMKRIIVVAEAERMEIEPLDPQHLQIYINPYSPYLLTKDVELIYSHIMKNQVKCMKTFEEYFIPLSFKSGGFNPNYLRQNEEFGEMLGLQLTKYHWENVHYVNKRSSKKPLYLDDGKKSMKSSVSLFKSMKY